MPPSTPFIDQETRELDTDQLLAEAVPLATLIGFVAVVALIPFLLAIAIDTLAWLFVILTQFILAVGSALVLVYVIARGIQLSK